jgi:DNA-binding NarL/FixJ family response regulator
VPGACITVGVGQIRLRVPYRRDTVLLMAMSVRVLIVDDQAPFRDVARTVVELTDGFEVVGEVETGEDSITSARSLRPDLILMDVNLPGISGLDATREILAGVEEARPVVVLVLSTYEADEYGPRATEAGAAGFISKSDFSPDRLTEAWAAATSPA